MDNEIQRYLPERVVFDFNNVTFMDSAGIGMLIGRYKVVRMIGGKVELINVKPSIKKIFEMCGLLKIIPIINESIEEEKNEKCVWEWNEIRIFKQI